MMTQILSNTDPDSEPGCPTMCVAAVDASKAFPSINRQQMWAVMASYGVPVGVIRLVEDMYTRGRSTYRTQGQFVHDQSFELLWWHRG